MKGLKSDFRLLKNFKRLKKVVTINNPLKATDFQELPVQKKKLSKSECIVHPNYLLHSGNI